MLGVAEDADKDVLGRNVGIHDTSNDDSGDCDAPNSLAHRARVRGRERRRGDIGADKDVDDNSGNEVEGGVDYLEEGDGLGEVLRLLEFTDDAEKARVAR